MNIIKEHLEQFFKIADERIAILAKKEIFKQQKPWTEDPIFLKYRFCNVFRHDDKVTRLIIEKVIKPNEDNPNLWKAIIIARFFSKLETIEELVKQGCIIRNFGGALTLLHDMQQHGPIMTSAFVLCPLLVDGKFLPKYLTPFHVIRYLNERWGGEIDSFFIKKDSLESIFNILKEAPCTGGFMAYEYVTDFSYSKRYFGVAPIDRCTWGNFQIGSLRGLKRLCGIKKIDKSKEGFNKDTIERLTTEILSAWKERWKDADVTMREVEHWLCEYDKYMRMLNGECKRLKRGYDG